MRGYHFETQEQVQIVDFFHTDSELYIHPEYGSTDDVVNLLDHPFPMKQFQGAFSQDRHLMNPYREGIFYIRVPEN